MESEHIGLLYVVWTLIFIFIFFGLGGNLSVLCSRFHVCEMEGFDRPKEPNSIEPTGAVMLQIRHNKGAYREWYKRKWKEDTHKRVQHCQDCKRTQVQVEKQLQTKVVENVGVTKGGATKSTNA
jgi:hypothetical protein